MIMKCLSCICLLPFTMTQLSRFEHCMTVNIVGILCAKIHFKWHHRVWHSRFLHRHNQWLSSLLHRARLPASPNKCRKQTIAKRCGAHLSGHGLPSLNHLPGCLCSSKRFLACIYLDSYFVAIHASRCTRSVSVVTLGLETGPNFLIHSKGSEAENPQKVKPSFGAMAFCLALMSSALAVTLATDVDDTILFQMDKVGKCISCTFGKHYWWRMS